MGTEFTEINFLKNILKYSVFSVVFLKFRNRNLTRDILSGAMVLSQFGQSKLLSIFINHQVKSKIIKFSRYFFSLLAG